MPVDMSVDPCIDMHISMCGDMSIDMRTDMCTCKQGWVRCGSEQSSVLTCV